MSIRKNALLTIQQPYTADNVNAPVRPLNCPVLGYACLYGDAADVERLISIGADPNHVVLSRRPFIRRWWGDGAQWTTVLAMLDAGMTLHTHYPATETMTCYVAIAVEACRQWPDEAHGWKRVLARLISAGCRVDVFVHGNPTLTIACGNHRFTHERADYELIDMVYQAGARRFSDRASFTILCSMRGLKTVEDKKGRREQVDAAYAVTTTRRYKYLAQRSAAGAAAVVVLGLARARSRDARGNGRDALRMVAWLVWGMRCSKEWRGREWRAEAKRAKI